MQLRHVFTELRTGLRRNLSMHLSVILTLFVSLSLAGVGMLVQREADLAADKLGDQLKILVNLCIEDDPSNQANCGSGYATEEQKDRIETEITGNDEVASYQFISRQEGYDNALATGQIPELAVTGPDPLITPETWPEGYWVTLENPEQADGIISALEGLDGVSVIKDERKALGQIFGIMTVLKYGSWIAAGFLLLAALLQVTNTIRLAALARRREIGIMRLVGASTLYIALPFLLEALVTAIIGVGLAAGSLAAFQYWGVEQGLAEHVQFLPWIGWDDYVSALIGLVPPGIVILGPVLTIVPTLLLTRKYVKV